MHFNICAITVDERTRPFMKNVTPFHMASSLPLNENSRFRSCGGEIIEIWSREVISGVVAHI